MLFDVSNSIHDAFTASTRSRQSIEVPNERVPVVEEDDTPGEIREAKVVKEPKDVKKAKILESHLDGSATITQELRDEGSCPMKFGASRGGLYSLRPGCPPPPDGLQLPGVP